MDSSCVAVEPAKQWHTLPFRESLSIGKFDYSVKMKKYLALLLLLLSVGLISFAVFVTYDNIVGAFGPGPPYYSQATNMDKWQNPVPYLIGLDLFVLVIVFFLTRWSLGVLRKK